MLTLYSSSVAAASYVVLDKAAQYRLITTDAFGQPFVFFRVIQWCDSPSRTILPLRY